MSIKMHNGLMLSVIFVALISGCSEKQEKPLIAPLITDIQVVVTGSMTNLFLHRGLILSDKRMIDALNCPEFKIDVLQLSLDKDMLPNANEWLFPFMKQINEKTKIRRIQIEYDVDMTDLKSTNDSFVVYSKMTPNTHESVKSEPNPDDKSPKTP